jgi:uncharacterized cupin superfamily protein
MTLRATAFETSRTDLVPQPIDPAWIKHGAPVARAVTVCESPDSLLTVGLWDCTAGTFTWIFASDEIVHILEGAVHVRHGHTTHVLVPGSVAYFPRGLETIWEVREYVKKSFVLRAPRPSLLHRAAWTLKACIAAIARRTRPTAGLLP